MFTLVIATVAALDVLWLWMIVDVLRWPRATWDAAGQRKSRWVVRLAILGWIGAIWYVASARRALQQAHAHAVP